MSAHIWADQCPACTCPTCRKDANRGNRRAQFFGKGHGWVSRYGFPGERISCPDCGGTGSRDGAAA